MQSLPQPKGNSETQSLRNGKKKSILAKTQESHIKKTVSPRKEHSKHLKGKHTRTECPRLPSVHYCVHRQTASHGHHIQKDHVISSDITIAKIRDKIVFTKKFRLK